MKPRAREWSERAEAEFALTAALRSLTARQCPEWFPRVRVDPPGLAIQRTHDPARRFHQVLAAEPLQAAFASGLKPLADGGVLPRQPGSRVTKAEARETPRRRRDLPRARRAAFGS